MWHMTYDMYSHVLYVQLRDKPFALTEMASNKWQNLEPIQ